MTGKNQDFIYAYDNEEHQIIVIDAETGERIGQRNSQVLAILSHLNRQNKDILLRKFAIWCAREVIHKIKPAQKKFIKQAKEAVHKQADEATLQQLYAESEAEAIATDTVGLRQGAKNAPAFLASRECVNPDAFEGAKNAARFHYIWAEINGKKNGLPDYVKKVGPPAIKEIIKETEQQQINCLLDLMSANQSS